MSLSRLEGSNMYRSGRPTSGAARDIVQHCLLSFDRLCNIPGDKSGLWTRTTVCRVFKLVFLFKPTSKIAGGWDGLPHSPLAKVPNLPLLI